MYQRLSVSHYKVAAEHFKNDPLTSVNGFRDFPISNIWQKWNHNIWRLTIQLAAAITQSYFSYTPNPIFWRKTKWTFRSKSVRCICCAAFPLTLFFAGCLQRQDNLVKPKMTGSDCLDFRVQVIDWIQVVTDDDFRGLISEHSGLKKGRN